MDVLARKMSPSSVVMTGQRCTTCASGEDCRTRRAPHQELTARKLCAPVQLIMKDLEADLRKVMAPATGSSLRESKRNVLKDFVHIAGPLGVTHFLILTATQNASYLRIAKTPRVRSS